MTDPRTQMNDDTAAPQTEPAGAGAADPTSASDIKYYQHSAFASLLTAEATRRARRARREAVALIPIVIGVVLLWKYREDVFGTDTPVRIAVAILLAAIGWRLARDIGRVL